MAPCGSAEQPAAGSDLQLVAEGALQSAARSDAGAVADDRVGLELCGLPDGGLLPDTHGVADLCTVLDLAGLSDRGTLIDRHPRTDAGVRLDLYVAADPRLGADGDLLTENGSIAEDGSRLDGRVVADRDAVPHGDGFDQPRPVLDPRAIADHGPVPDHDALTERDVRSDGHVRADGRIVTDGDALVDSGAGVDLDVLTELRAGIGPCGRDCHLGLAPGDGPELASVAGLAGVALAHLRTGACSRLRRRHDRLPSSSWSHLVEVGGGPARAPAEGPSALVSSEFLGLVSRP